MTFELKVTYNEAEEAEQQEATLDAVAGEGQDKGDTDRDIRLLRCLQPCVPPTTGCTCTINDNRKGRLMMEQGFLEDTNKTAQIEDQGLSSLPLGESVW